MPKQITSRRRKTESCEGMQFLLGQERPVTVKVLQQLTLTVSLSLLLKLLLFLSWWDLGTRKPKVYSPKKTLSTHSRLRWRPFWTPLRLHLAIFWWDDVTKKGFDGLLELASSNPSSFPASRLYRQTTDPRLLNQNKSLEQILCSLHFRLFIHHLKNTQYTPLDTVSFKPVVFYKSYISQFPKQLET